MHLIDILKPLYLNCIYKPIKMNILFVILPCLFFAFANGRYDNRRRKICQRIQEPKCQGIGYQMTGMPNVLNHWDQDEASNSLKSYTLLIDFSCSKKLLFFLCTIHFPLCDHKVLVPMPACRPMCEEVRRECEPTMKKLGYDWPVSFNCSKLPIQSKKNLCIQDPDTQYSFDGALPTDKPMSNVDYLPPGKGLVEPPLEIPDYGNNEDTDDLYNDYFDQPVNNKDINHNFEIRQPKYNDEKVKQHQNVPQCSNNPDKYVYHDKSKKCLPRCNSTVDIMYNSRDKKFTYYWMTVCSLLCFLFSTSTVITFLIDTKRFIYPERAIVFLSLSYSLYATGYLIRVAGGLEDTMICVNNQDGQSYITHGVLKNTGCMANFLLLYYSGMAASVWWVIISVSWFMAAGLKWGEEAIEANGYYFHLVAWLLPAIQTIVVFLLKKVDGDELTGMCYVGNWDREALLWFVIVPLTCYLAIGTIALLAGFASLFKVKRVITNSGAEKKTKKHKKLIFKIGLFSLLYIIPAFGVIVVNVFQYKKQSSWEMKAENTWCQMGIPDNSFGNYPNAPPDLYKQTSYRYYPGYPPYARQPAGNGEPFGRKFGQETRPLYYPNNDNLEYPRSEEFAEIKSNYQQDSGSYEYDYNAGSNYYDSGTLFNGKSLFKLSDNQRYSQNMMRPYRYYPHPVSYDNGFQYYEDPYFMANHLPLDGDRNIDCSMESSIPPFHMMAVKIFLSLIAGIATGIWIWNGKTYIAWKTFCFCRGCKKNRCVECPSKTLNTPENTGFICNNSDQLKYGKQCDPQRYHTDEYLSEEARCKMVNNKLGQNNYEECQVKNKCKKKWFWMCIRKSNDNKIPHLIKHKTQHVENNQERYVQVNTKNSVRETSNNVPLKYKSLSLSEMNNMEVNKTDQSCSKPHSLGGKRNYYNCLPHKGNDVVASSPNIGARLANDKYIAQKPNLLPTQYNLKLSYVSQPSGLSGLTKTTSQQREHLG